MNITPHDIKAPGTLSGFRYVSISHGGDRPNPFYAEANRGGGRNERAFRGPMRRTAAEAAQDYCDWINTGGLVARATALKTPGHQGRRDNAVIDEEEQAALGVLRDKRAQRRFKQQGYIYAITDGTAIKIGYSLKPEARVAELQTGNPRPLRLLATTPGTEADEKALHVKHLRHNLLMEWFRPTRSVLSSFGLTKEVLNG